MALRRRSRLNRRQSMPREPKGFHHVGQRSRDRLRDGPRIFAREPLHQRAPGRLFLEIDISEHDTARVLDCVGLAAHADSERRSIFHVSDFRHRHTESKRGRRNRAKMSAPARSSRFPNVSGPDAKRQPKLNCCVARSENSSSGSILQSCFAAIKASSREVFFLPVDSAWPSAQ